MENTEGNSNNNNIITNDLPNKVVVKALEELLDRKFPFNKYTYELHKATEKGDNYIGVVYRILVNLDVKTSKSSSFSFILKVPPRNLARRKQFFARPCFLREFFAYEEFSPLLAEFQKSKGVTTVESFHEYAACYGCCQAEFDEAIFMKDLRIQHFELFDRFEVIDGKHVALVMSTYAKLHAVSFAIKDQHCEQLLRFQNIQDIFEQRKDDVGMCAYFEELKVSTLATLDAERDQCQIAVLQQYFAQASFMELLLALIDGKRCEPFAMICHGDCWINNILFKHQNEAPIDIRLKDWQIMRYASPITDLMYFLFSCTTGSFSQGHFSSMLKLYYIKLSAQITRLGSDPEQLFPRAAFDDQLKRIGAVGLLLAMIVLPIVTIKGEDALNLEELGARIESGEKTDLQSAGLLSASNANAYSTRMRDVILDCIDLGYIKF